MSTRELDILAIGAHPDDVEIGAAGSLLLAAASGKRTAILDLTYAELSSNGTVERRQQEAAAADKLLGVCARYNFGLPDRGLEAVREQAIERVVKLIRKTRPRTVLAPYFSDRHPDHESVSRIVREAIFNAGIRKYMPDPELPAYRPAQFLYYFINSTVTPQVVVDITTVFPQKWKSSVATAASSSWKKAACKHRSRTGISNPSSTASGCLGSRQASVMPKGLSALRRMY